MTRSYDSPTPHGGGSHPRLVAIYRSPTYSPLQHASNDTAILDETTRWFEEWGYDVHRVGERDVVGGAIPHADLYLNMCQGAAASEVLVPLESTGAPVFNRPTSVLNCHRHRLVRLLDQSGLAFPTTKLVPTSGPVDEHQREEVERLRERAVWIKRGDVHAERPEDVVAVLNGGFSRAMATFAERGIPWVALQEHVPGPVLKFYGVASGGLFHAYVAETKAEPTPDIVDLAVLRRLAFAAAAQVGLDVFGGDVAVPEPSHPVLIDLNDWPSFAPIRTRAARAIADHIHAKFQQGVAS